MTLRARFVHLALLVFLGLGGLRGAQASAWQVRSLGVHGCSVAWSEAADLILFEERGNRGRRWVSVVQPDGGGRRRLAQGTGASWAPDGTRVAYLAPEKQDGPARYPWLSVYSLATGRSQRVARLPSVSRLFWSPDGRGVVYVGERPAGKGDIVRSVWVYQQVEPEPVAPVSLGGGPGGIRYAAIGDYDHECGEFAFGMQGAAYAWVSLMGSEKEPYAMHLRYGVIEASFPSLGGTMRELLPPSQLPPASGVGPRHPAWHPGKPILFFDAYGALWEMDILTRRVVRAWPTELGQAPRKASASSPGVSPDGGRIAFVLSEGGKPDAVAVMGLEGGSQQKTVLGVLGERAVPYGDPRCFPVLGSRFAWGPDDDSIVFIGEDGQLFIARARPPVDRPDRDRGALIGSGTFARVPDEDAGYRVAAWHWGCDGKIVRRWAWVRGYCRATAAKYRTCALVERFLREADRCFERKPICGPTPTLKSCY